MTFHEHGPMPLTFFVILFSVLVFNESPIVVGLYKVVKGLC